MRSRLPRCNSKAHAQDLQYGLNWRKLLEVLGLLDNLDDRVAIVRNMRGSKPVLGHI